MTIDITAEHIDPDDAKAYRLLADKVIEWFNPPGGEESEESILMDAVLRAGKFIEAQPCTCDPDEAAIYGEACPRCAALGRIEDQPEER